MTSLAELEVQETITSSRVGIYGGDSFIDV